MIKQADLVKRYIAQRIAEEMNIKSEIAILSEPEKKKITQKEWDLRLNDSAEIIREELEKCFEDGYNLFVSVLKKFVKENEE